MEGGGGGGGRGGGGGAGGGGSGDSAFGLRRAGGLWSFVRESQAQQGFIGTGGRATLKSPRLVVKKPGQQRHGTSPSSPKILHGLPTVKMDPQNPLGYLSRRCTGKNPGPTAAGGEVFPSLQPHEVSRKKKNRTRAPGGSDKTWPANSEPGGHAEGSSGGLPRLPVSKSSTNPKPVRSSIPRESKTRPAGMDQERIQALESAN